MINKQILSINLLWVLIEMPHANYSTHHLLPSNWRANSYNSIWALIGIIMDFQEIQLKPCWELEDQWLWMMNNIQFNVIRIYLESYSQVLFMMIIEMKQPSKEISYKCRHYSTNAQISETTLRTNNLSLLNLIKVLELAFREDLMQFVLTVLTGFQPTKQGLTQPQHIKHHLHRNTQLLNTKLQRWLVLVQVLGVDWVTYQAYLDWEIKMFNFEKQYN